MEEHNGRRRSQQSSADGSLQDYRMSHHRRSGQSSKCSSCGSSKGDEYDEKPPYSAPHTPPRLLSSPSAASSLGLSSSVMSPLRKELSRTTYDIDDHGSLPSTPGMRRITLARRLSHLAQQLTDDNDIDQLAELTTQVDELEKAMQSPSPSQSQRSYETPSKRPGGFEMRSRSDMGGSLLSSPASSLYRSRFSDLSASLMARNPEPDTEITEPQPTVKMGMTVKQAKKVITEANKLNEELTTVINNLRARQEEADHIQDLLIERAERAAQRILFLQNRITYLEQELQENDDELQHLRICLKGVEIQMPPHPDIELQRCITTLKRDYQALKKKRAASRSSITSLENSTANILSSPLR